MEKEIQIEYELIDISFDYELSEEDASLLDEDLRIRTKAKKRKKRFK